MSAKQSTHVPVNGPSEVDPNALRFDHDLNLVWAKSRSLEGLALDYAAIRIEHPDANIHVLLSDDPLALMIEVPNPDQEGELMQVYPFFPNLGDGALHPLMAREKISVVWDAGGVEGDGLVGCWSAMVKNEATPDGFHNHDGDTPLQALLRCFVTQKGGESVRVPRAFLTPSIEWTEDRVKGPQPQIAP